MKIILIFVSSLDGKVTKWGNPHIKLWSSHQDQDYYKKIWDKSQLIIMGSSTFNAESFPPSNHQLIIMTGDPDKYKSLGIPGQIEFTKESPVELTARFKSKGHKKMLVVGGPHVATSFLKEQLIDELWLTLEPKIFGIGDNFVRATQLDINLRLIRCEKVNEQGTLITKYAILKNGIIENR